MGGVNSDVTAFGTIKGGRLFLRSRRVFDQQIATFKDGTEVEVEVTKRRATRSPFQNAWYWGCIVHLISEHTGYAPDELHDVLKMKFLPKRLAFCDGNGEVKDDFVIGGSTRRLNVLEFGEYCEAIRQWAAESLDVNIPDPDPNWKEAAE